MTPKSLIFARSDGLTIAPPSTKIEIDPGDVKTETIRVHNPTNEVITVYPKPMDFKADGEEGNPAFYPPKEESRDFSLSKWLSFHESTLILTPNQTVNFDYKIIVPEEAEPGGHYGAIFFTRDPENQTSENGNLSVGTMIGQLIFLTVSGDISKVGVLEEFRLDNKVNFGEEVSFLTRVTNIGNVHYPPVGTITISNSLGKEVSKISINEQEKIVLPNSTRKFITKWKPDKFSIGPHKVVLVVAQNNDVPLKVEEVVFIIPWWSILGLISVVAGVILWLRRNLKKRQKSLKNIT